MSPIGERVKAIFSRMRTRMPSTMLILSNFVFLLTVDSQVVKINIGGAFLKQCPHAINQLFQFFSGCDWGVLP